MIHFQSILYRLLKLLNFCELIYFKSRILIIKPTWYLFLCDRCNSYERRISFCDNNLVVCILFNNLQYQNKNVQSILKSNLRINWNIFHVITFVALLLFSYQIVQTIEKGYNARCMQYFNKSLKPFHIDCEGIGNSIYLITSKVWIKYLPCFAEFHFVSINNLYRFGFVLWLPFSSVKLSKRMKNSVLKCLIILRNIGKYIWN